MLRKNCPEAILQTAFDCHLRRDTIKEWRAVKSACYKEKFVR